MLTSLSQKKMALFAAHLNGGNMWDNSKIERWTDRQEGTEKDNASLPAAQHRKHLLHGLQKTGTVKSLILILFSPSLSPPSCKE